MGWKDPKRPRCEICDQRDPGHAVMCDVVRAQGDRIAKLEADIRMLRAWTACDEQLSAAAAGKTSGDAESASRPGTPAAAGPIPPGYALAPGWELSGGHSLCAGPTHRIGPVKVDASYVSYAPARSSACAECAVKLGALVRAEPPDECPGCDDHCEDDACDKTHGPCVDAEPPAPAQGAPAEPLSARIKRALSLSPMVPVSNDDLRAWIDAAAALEARLAAAERSVDRHRLVLDEERRCYGILKAKLAAAERELYNWKSATRIAEKDYADAEKRRIAAEIGCRAAEEAMARLEDTWKRAERERDDAKREAGDWAERASLARSEERKRCLAWAQNTCTVGPMLLHEIRDAIRDGRPAP